MILPSASRRGPPGLRRLRRFAAEWCCFSCIARYHTTDWNRLLRGRMGMRAAYGRRYDLVGDVKVPDRAAAAGGEFSNELRQIVQALEGSSREPEAARDASEIAIAEYRPFLGHSFGAQLVHFGAVGAVVHHDDENVQPVALDGFELLHVHHQATVAVEQHDGALGARRRHAHGERDAVADRAELADGEKLLLRPGGHLREEP